MSDRINDSQPKMPAALPAETQTHTLGGQLIADLRDFIGGAPANAQAAEKQNSSDEQIANIAANTIAMIPGVHWFAAGAIRATLLCDPTSGLLQNGGSFAKNFAEGAALSGVTKFGSQIMDAKIFGDSTFTRSIMSKSVGLFSFGFGMGAVQSGFASDSWRAGNGKLSAAAGVEHLLEAGTIGGVIGVPAGFVGLGIGSLGLTAAGRAGLTDGVAKIASSAGSGYAAGAVFGGVEAATHGQSFSQALSQANEGGIVGLFAGGATGAFVHAPEAAAAPSKNGVADVAQRPDTAASSVFGPAKTNAPSAAEALRQSPEHQGASESFSVPSGQDSLYNRLYFDRPPDTIDGALQKLGSYQLYSDNFAVLRENATALPPPADEAVWREIATRVVQKDVRVYSVHGTKIVVPDDYAAKLDDVLALRQHVNETAQRSYAGDATAADRTASDRALAALKQHPLNDRAHPIDLLNAIAELPDRSLSPRIEMVDWANPDDPWHSATYEKGFVSGATASRDDGTITFYNAKRGAFLEQTQHHEWGHLLKFSSNRESELFDAAFLVEGKGYNVSTYAERNSDENFAEHYESLTRPDPTAFFETVDRAPIRSVVLGKALVKALAFAPKGQDSVMARSLAERVDYIQRETMPLAQKQLATEVFAADTPQQRAAAAKLLADFGSDDQFGIVKNIARTSREPLVARAAFEQGFARVFRNGESWKGYNMTSGPDTTDEQISYLVDMAQSGSQSRSYALEYLDSLPGAKARDYYDLLTLDTYQGGSKVGRAFALMQSIPDVQGKRLAFDEALKLIGNDPNGRVNLALVTLDRVPEMRSAALDVLQVQAQPRTLPVLEEVAKSKNATWADKAKLAIEHIQMKQVLFQFETQMQSQSATERAQAIAQLAKTQHTQAIVPLLKAVASADLSDRAAAIETLRSNFDAALVKHYARGLISEDPRWSPSLRVILDGGKARAAPVKDSSYSA